MTFIIITLGQNIQMQNFSLQIQIVYFMKLKQKVCFKDISEDIETKFDTSVFF